MAVAAYASLLSLAHTLDQQVQHPVHHLHTEQLRSLQEKVMHLQHFLEHHSQSKISQEVEDVARQIPVLANEAEDVIDSHVVSQWASKDTSSSDHDAAAALSSFYQDLDKVIQKVDSIIKELMEVVVKEELDDVKEPKLVVDSLPTNATSSRVLPSGGENSTMVGFDDRLVQIIDELTRDESDLKILPIVGMGGIGKTTLARNVFDHAYILKSFDIRIWFIISQEYSVQEILLGLLYEEKKERSEETLAELGKQLHQKLFGRRYLIVMDDVWSNKAWDDLKQFFPNNGNRSRVLVTTRLSNLAVSLGSKDPYLMGFLDEQNCWNLLCVKAFGQEGCPYSELEQIGKDIAEGCRGLPLALVVIDGLLAKSNMTLEYWESVAKNINSFANSEDNEYCLKTSGNIKSIRIHDLLRDLCLRESERENFIRVPRVERTSGIEEDRKKCYLCHNEAFLLDGRIDVSEIHVGLQSTSVATALVCEDCKSMYPDLMRLRWVKAFGRPGGEFLQHTRLRYISFGNRYSDIRYKKDVISSSTLPLLWNLQTLYVKTDDDKSKIVLPSEIWMMPQLRHINITWAVLPDPDPDPVDAKDHTTTILENLQNLSLIQKFKCAKKVVEKIPNLKELQVNYPSDLSEWSYFQLHNLAHLHKLESLSLNATKFPLKSITFPTSLKKLVLEHCEIPWEDMTVIGSLPNLEVLKLRYHASSGPEWNPVVGEFLRLKFLLIESGELVRCTAEDVHFPSLEVLIMESMRNLGEIHSSIGGIATLKLIQLRYCFGDIENSAKQILEEQRSNGNESLQVVIGGISL
ncbi:UNVERIFIED_CONTAM: putative disease resistance RPP13-like protein 3 [Sesamum radiatum]|uniref:Disease resistance RPP13-like protein 3 n=1 Tax=Sesamum radiatum TaxID=300843 RepID=A0AAW2ULZ2_SESRA